LKRSRTWKIIGLIASIIVLIEGLGLFLLAGPLVNSKSSPISATDVQMYGLILIILALIPDLFFGFEPYIQMSDSRRKLIMRTSSIIVPICGIVIAAFAIFVALSFGTVTMDSLGTIPIYVMAAIAGQLFLLGLIIVIAQLNLRSEFKVTNMLSLVFGAAIAAEGVVILGISAQTYIEGLGTILKRTVDLAGIQLLAIGLAFIILSILAEKVQRGSNVLGFLNIATAAIVTVEGFTIMALSTNVTIDGIGTITARTVTIAGAQLGILGLGCLVLLGIGSNSPTPRLRKVSNLVVVFLILLIPVAALSSAFTF
jgi:hypothetical protein